jgi:hypothetical protein
MTHEYRGAQTVRTFQEFDRWLGHAVHGRSPRNQLWLGRPGVGKTARIQRLVRNSVGSDRYPDLQGRVEAPIYGGRITPAKWFIRGWQHRLEPLLILNDLQIGRVDSAWESMLCQFLEQEGRRTIRWDPRSAVALDPSDRRGIERYLRRMGLLDRFLESQHETEEEAIYGDRVSPCDPLLPNAGPPGPGCEDAEDVLEPQDGQAELRLELPRSYETESTVILVANNLGDRSWDRIYSRLRTFVFEPLVTEQIADIKTWSPPIPGAILGVIEEADRRGEILSLDYRRVMEAWDALRLAENWEDPLREAFYGPTDVEVQLDADNILDWLAQRRARCGREFTEREMYDQVASLRGERKRARRSDALDWLVRNGWIERFRHPSVLRPGQRGRRPGPSFRVLKHPAS